MDEAMNKGSMLQEKNGRKRTGLVVDYDYYDSKSSQPPQRWCEILWSDGELECLDSQIPDWNRRDEIEVIVESH
tara:strand:- start:21 stop:242 length:222 start_codon:yes stop_codon:yes gene_type:complete